MTTARSSLEPPVEGAEPLFDSAALRTADRRASERHRIPSLLLMDRASRAAADVICAAYPAERAALVICGSGNNGGDGYAVARHLADAGWEVEIATPRGCRPETPDAMTMATIVKTLGIRPRTYSSALLSSPRIVVDALLGIGAHGAPRGAIGAVVGELANSAARLVSLDVPSGVDADTGQVLGAAVCAAHTVTFHGDKPGLHITPGRVNAGIVTVVDIGIPSTVASAPSGWLLGDAVTDIPTRPAGADKYSAGAVLVVAGSPGMTGAAILCSRAALRAGAGLVVTATPATAQSLVADGAPEVMVVAIPDLEGAFTSASVDRVVAEAGRVGAVALGPGIGRSEATTAFVRAVLEAVDKPVVIDADGLWHLAARPTWLRKRQSPTIITPHAGEAARLLGTDRDLVDNGRLSAARRLADRTGAVTVVKGSGTIIASPDGTAIVDGIGTSALATAGTGDVLTGVVAARLAAGVPALRAAALAVAVHGRAGIAAGRGRGTVAGDVIEQLSFVGATRD